MKRLAKRMPSKAIFGGFRGVEGNGNNKKMKWNGNVLVALMRQEIKL